MLRGANLPIPLQFETLKIASMGKIKVDCASYKLSEAEDLLIKLKQGKIVGRAVLVP